MNDALLLKSVEMGLEDLEIIPLFGGAPPFPFEEFSTLLGKSFDIDNVQLTVQLTQHCSFEELTESMGKAPYIQPFSLSPLPGNYFFILQTEGKKNLSRELLYTGKQKKGLIDETLEEGFFQSIILTTCALFNQLGRYGNLTTVLAEDSPLPPEGALSVDVSIKLGTAKTMARICIPKESLAAFKTHFATQSPPPLTTAALKSTPLPLQLIAGSTILSAREWADVTVGDFVLLDRSTYDCEQKRGTAQIILGNTPLFDVRIKDGEMKILEYSQTLEEPSMTDDKPIPEEPTSQEPALETQKEEPLWSSEDEGTSEAMLTSKEIPLPITVEVGRFKMPLDKITQLKPGNVLDLSLNPQLGVHLTIAGKRIAKGELVKLGEGIGVKILSIGQ